MQVNSYIEKYQYTYTGMQKALIYFYEVQGNEVDTTNPTLGIVPYIYDEAYNYYYELWKINKENSNKDLEHFCPETLEVHIPPPQRKIKKRKLFTFLDKEGEDK